MYRKIVKIDQDTNKDIIVCIQRESDKAFIPLNPDNADYQDYLKWAKEQPNIKSVEDLPARE